MLKMSCSNKGPRVEEGPVIPAPRYMSLSHTHFRQVKGLSYFFSPKIKYSNRNDLKEKGFVSVHTLRWQSTMVGKPQHQKLEVAGGMANKMVLHQARWRRG